MNSMSIISSVSDVSASNSLDPLKVALEKDEIESFCKVMSLGKEEARFALSNLKTFLNTEEYLSFKKLKGGDCNAPILAFKSVGTIPIGVFKHESDSSWAETRMRAIDEMRKDGFENLPYILKDKNGKYLVSLGKASYSCIEYFEPDADQSSSFEQMCMLASKFHTYSKRSSLTEELRESSPDKYSGSNISYLDPELLKWDPSIFETEAWEECVRHANYFTSQSFLTVYHSLPTQLIHGDITPYNTIISGGKSFFIDLDKVRTDVRLLDFATFSGWSFLEQYLTSIEKNTLLSCIQDYYGHLEEVEKEYFPVIVLFVRYGVLDWSLRVLKQSLLDKDLQTVQQFRCILTGTVREIYEMCKRIPQLKKLCRSFEP